MTILLLQASILFLGFTLSIFLFKTITRTPRLPPKAPLPPGPKPWPIIGNISLTIRNKPFFRWMHNTMSQMGYEIFCVRLGSVHVIAVTSPEIACEFLKKQDAIFTSRPTFLSLELVGSGFFTTAFTTGDQWKKMRRVMISHILSPTTFQWMHDKRAEEVNHLVRYVYNVINSNEGVVDIRVAAQHFCGNMMRNMIFSKRFFGKGDRNGGPGPEEEEHIWGIFTMLMCVNNFCISDYLPFLRGRMDLDGNEKRTRQAVESSKKYQDPEIDMRIKQWKVEGTRTKKYDLLDLLITLKDGQGNALLTSEEIKAQVMEIMLATVDNPANTVEWALAEMINHPETLVKAIQELDQVVGKDRLVQESDLQHLNYITACAKESFRLHPVNAFNIPHVSISDTIVAGYFIPKGSHILLSRQGLGRNFRIWDEPLRFKPERHLNFGGSHISLNHPDLHLFSFGIGRRGCPAIHLGSTVTIMLLAQLLQGFTWSLPSNATYIELVEVSDGMVLSEPLHVVAKPRLNEKLYV